MTKKYACCIIKARTKSNGKEKPPRKRRQVLWH
nr:MAG TPA: hypothetical protein [Caudoviricetes sp.]